MKKRNRALAVAFIIFGIAALSLIAVVYAKYVSEITKTGTATVAKWSFATDNTSGQITCPLDQTYDTDTLVADRIAPGTSGRCPIVISNANTEVGIEYSISPSTTNKPTNLKFYSDAAHQNEITSSTTLTDTLTPGQAATTINIYWYWAYEDATDDDYDDHDTTDGEAGSSMTMTFNITGTQLEPTI